VLPESLHGFGEAHFGDDGAELSRALAAPASRSAGVAGRGPSPPWAMTSATQEPRLQAAGEAEFAEGGEAFVGGRAAAWDSAGP
jgi:hypothetical protein